jgi:serine/threonine-protein kinase
MIQAVLGERYRLGERIAATWRLPFAEAFALGEQVARALAAAHAHGLVHRDVKPANVLLGPGGAKVTDFGIAKAATAATLTRTGMVLGSANYVAPEQAQGDDVGPAADQYSLGCVLFEAVTGRTPYAGANPVAIATQHVSSPVPDPRSDLPDLPAPAADLIRRAWPSTRPTASPRPRPWPTPCPPPPPRTTAPRFPGLPKAGGNPAPGCRDPRRGSVARSPAGCRELSTAHRRAVRRPVSTGSGGRRAGPIGPGGRWWRWERSS